eukprot:XP_008653793.1 uncharacterized protein LOC103633909 [Zea mays]
MVAETVSSIMARRSGGGRGGGGAVVSGAEETEGTRARARGRRLDGSAGVWKQRRSGAYGCSCAGAGEEEERAPGGWGPQAYWHSIEHAGLGGSDESGVSSDEANSSDSFEEWSGDDGDDEGDGSGEGDSSDDSSKGNSGSGSGDDGDGGNGGS